MEEQLSWFDEAPVTDATVKELDALCDKTFAQRDKVDHIKEMLKEEEKKLEKLKSKIIEYLSSIKKKTWKTENGAVTSVEIWAVTPPKEMKDKRAFFEYLKANDTFEELVNINSKTLQKFYREAQEEALRKGEITLESEFKIPGLGDPTLIQKVSMRRS